MEYSKSEEIANSITHGLGAIFGIVATVLLVVFASLNGSSSQIVSVAIYGSTLIILYTCSTLYHALLKTRAKKIFKVFDHASVYLLIAGSYTPFALILLTEKSYIGWVIFGIIWGLAIIGITLSTIFIGKFRVLKTLMYILMGWLIIFAIPDLTQILNGLNKISVLYLLLAGGISYTLGTVFYLLKIRYFHVIWHLFVLAGTILHFIAIMMCVL